MSRSFLILFIVIIASAISINAQLCGENEGWVDCGSPCARRICDDLKKPEPIVCAAMCIVGCQCQPDYIRVSWTNQTCIPTKDCPKN